jgi:iron complex outermembrane recepter protein
MAGTRRLYGSTHEVDKGGDQMYRFTFVFGVTQVAAACSVALFLPTPTLVAQERAASALEEVVVTARRREENLQEVPIAITALSAEDLEMRNIENIEDLNVLLPNVDIRGTGTNGAASGQFAVRGIPGVARYFDGVVYSGGQGALANVIELERIEVLRGPQGTLFGKNAIGGAIQYISARPAEDFGARIKGTIGESNRREVIANVDIPLSDSVRSKITYASLKRDGYVESTVIDEKYGAEDNEVVRGMLEWSPSDKFTGTVIVERNEIDQNMGPNVLWNIYEEVGTAMAYQNAYLAGDPNVPVAWTDNNFSFGQRGEYKTTSNHTGAGTEFFTTAIKADLQWNLTDSILLRSISGVRDLEWGNYDDIDGSQYVQFERWGFNSTEETSQELQLLGGGDRFSWVVGLYYYEQDAFDKLYSWQTIETSPRLMNTLTHNINTDTAIFAEGSYDITDRLTLTLGGRFSNEEFEFNTLDPAEALPPPNNFSRSTAGTVRLVGGVPVHGTVEFDQFTPRLALQYQFTDSVMGYVSLSQGFDGGGVNSRFDPTLPNNGIIPFDGQTLDNVEVGLRSDLLNDRLRFNVTYFDGVWEDIQVAEVLTPGTTTTTNAGEAQIDGLEIEGLFSVGEHVALNFALGWLNSGYTDVGQATTISVGTPFPFAPERSYSVGMQFNADLENGGTLLTRFDYGWFDDFETFRDMRFHVSAVNEAYGLLSARLQYTPPDGNWDLALIGTNLNDEYYRLGGFPAILAGIDQGVVARPREIGVSITVRL